MTSQFLYMKLHPVHRATYTLSMWHHSCYSVSSHPLYWQHHTQSLYDITLAICMASFALYKTTHPHFMTSNHHFYDITPAVFDIVSTLSLSSHPCIDDITPTVFMRSHPMYMTTSYPLYITTYALDMWHHSHCICVSHQLFPWYHTLCMYNITPTMCLTSYTLYKASRPHFMTSHHII